MKEVSLGLELGTETAGRGFEPAAGCPSTRPVTTLEDPLLHCLHRASRQEQLRAVVMLDAASCFLRPQMCS